MAKRKSKINKTSIYIVTTIAIIFLIAFAIYKYMMSNYNYLKQDISEHLVYTIKETSNSKYIKTVPYINMKAQSIETVNQEIQQFSNKYLNIEKSIMTYEYDVNGQILSIILKASNYDNGEYPEVEFLSFNINLEDQTIVDDKTLLSYYEYTEDYVSSKIESQLKTYYDELLKQRYFAARECKFNCFLASRGIKNYLKDIEYFIKDGDLYVYKSFIVVSVYGEEKYFTEDHFVFNISK